MLHCRTSASWAKGWRDDCIDLMAGLRQIAADLLQHSKSAALGHFRTHAVQQKPLFPRAALLISAPSSSRAVSPLQSASSRSPAEMHGNLTARITSDAAFSHSQGQSGETALIRGFDDDSKSTLRPCRFAPRRVTLANRRAQSLLDVEMSQIRRGLVLLDRRVAATSSISIFVRLCLFFRPGIVRTRKLSLRLGHVEYLKGAT